MYNIFFGMNFFRIFQNVFRVVLPSWRVGIVAQHFLIHHKQQFIVFIFQINETNRHSFIP